MLTKYDSMIIQRDKVKFNTSIIFYTQYTVNVVIFTCINFHGFMKMGNFACIKIRVFSTNDTLGYIDSNFHSVYIFADN